LNELFGHPLPRQELHPLGARLGADVPFFLLGHWAMVEGIGDRLTPVSTVPILWTVLVAPGFQVFTRWAYENLTLTTRPNGSKFSFLGDTSADEMAASHQRILDRQQLTFEDILPLLSNDFEPLVFGHYPQLHNLRNDLLGAGAKAVSMTGSGPTLVGFFGSEAEARAAHDFLAGRDDVNSFVVHTLDTACLPGTHRG
jgi:4-diphosphocytidyl-2-C-methyl-D-erythritol kinase